MAETRGGVPSTPLTDSGGTFDPPDGFRRGVPSTPPDGFRIQGGATPLRFRDKHFSKFDKIMFLI